MPLASVFNGRATRQQWWTAVLLLVAAWLVWSMASGFLFMDTSGMMFASFLSLVFLVPLAWISARRLNDLGRPVAKTLALVLTPFVLHTVFTSLTLGVRETTLETGFSDTQAVVLEPTLVGWIVIAWLLAAIVWMAMVLGKQPGTSELDAQAA